jgi:hypothetical protein
LLRRPELVERAPRNDIPHCVIASRRRSNLVVMIGIAASLRLLAMTEGDLFGCRLLTIGSFALDL